MQTIELLAPAKNKAFAFAAIAAGADALYVGGPKFTARAEASVSFDDIAQIVKYMPISVTLRSMLF